MPGDRKAGFGVGGEGLATAQPGVVETGCRRRGEDSPIGVEVHERDADTVEPSQGFEADAAGVADDNNSAQSVADFGVAALAALLADAVANDESSSFDS